MEVGKMRETEESLNTYNIVESKSCMQLIMGIVSPICLLHLHTSEGCVKLFFVVVDRTAATVVQYFAKKALRLAHEGIAKVRESRALIAVLAKVAHMTIKNSTPTNFDAPAASEVCSTHEH